MGIKEIEPLYELKGHKSPVISLAYSEKSAIGDSVLASGSEDNTCRIWDLKTRKVIKGIQGLDSPVTSINFAKKSSLPYLYLSSGTQVYTYDMRNEGIILTEPSQVYDFSKDEINYIDVSENNKYLATADDNGAVNIIDLCSHKIYKKTSKQHQNICMSVKFRPKKSWDVWSGGMDSKVYEWDFSRGLPTNIYDMSAKEPSTAQMFNPPFVYEISMSPNGEWIAAGLGDTTIQLLSPPNKKQKKYNLEEIKLEDGHNSMVNCLQFIDTKDKILKLVSGGMNGRITVWDPLKKDKDMYKLDESMGKLNTLKAFEFDSSLQIAAAGTSKANAGVLNIYELH